MIFPRFHFSVRQASLGALLVTLLTHASTAWATEATAPSASPAIQMDPVSLIRHASGPVFVVVWLLIFASVLVWFVGALKILQLRRWSTAQANFEDEASAVISSDELYELARMHPDAPGARIVARIEQRAHLADLLPSVARRGLVDEEKRASSLMPTLASIGSASPFIGLFGTVYGIMDAFLRIGREKSASLPVVAPAIGEALIATAIGLFAAIPAVIAYNAIAKRMDDLMAQVEASTEGWVALEQGSPRTNPQPRISGAAPSTPLPLNRATSTPNTDGLPKPAPAPRKD